mmetsp:Transcript_3418/g.10693  ORF Transcript_3418/g.10693 Transcript_3418/m.10693 type:complete len:280 (+) Transcript_3418:2023-2862(+)
MRSGGRVQRLVDVVRGVHTDGRARLGPAHQREVYPRIGGWAGNEAARVTAAKGAPAEDRRRHGAVATQHAVLDLVGRVELPADAVLRTAEHSEPHEQVAWLALGGDDVHDHGVVHVDEERLAFLGIEREEVHRLQLRRGVHVVAVSLRLAQRGVVNLAPALTERLVVHGHYGAPQLLRHRRSGPRGPRPLDAAVEHVGAVRPRLVDVQPVVEALPALIKHGVAEGLVVQQARRLQLARQEQRQATVASLALGDGRNQRLAAEGAPLALGQRLAVAQRLG